MQSKSPQVSPSPGYHPFLHPVPWRKQSPLGSQCSALAAAFVHTLLLILCLWRPINLQKHPHETAFPAPPPLKHPRCWLLSKLWCSGCAFTKLEAFTPLAALGIRSMVSRWSSERWVLATEHSQAKGLAHFQVTWQTVMSAKPLTTNKIN